MIPQPSLWVCDCQASRLNRGLRHLGVHRHRRHHHDYRRRHDFHRRRVHRHLPLHLHFASPKILRDWTNLRNASNGSHRRHRRRRRNPSSDFHRCGSDSDDSPFVVATSASTDFHRRDSGSDDSPFVAATNAASPRSLSHDRAAVRRRDFRTETIDRPAFRYVGSRPRAARFSYLDQCWAVSWHALIVDESLPRLGGRRFHADLQACGGSGLLSVSAVTHARPYHAPGPIARDPGRLRARSAVRSQTGGYQTAAGSLRHEILGCD